MTASRSASVVICTFADERLDSLRAAFASALAQTVPPLQVIVAVDHNAALLERVRDELPAATAVANAHQRGLSGTRNSGVAAARGDVVAFLDDDAVAAPDWLERLLAHYGPADVLGVGGRIEPRWLEREPRTLPAEFHWVCGCSYAGMPEAAATVRNVIGANMSVRREVLLRAGGFGSGLGRVGRRPLGCEETELCIRASHLVPGGRFVYEPSALVRHEVPAARTTWRYFVARCLAEGRSKALVSRRVGRTDALASERSYVVRALPRALGRGLLDGARGDPAGPVRAARVLVGLAAASAGYAAGALGEAPA